MVVSVFSGAHKNVEFAKYFKVQHALTIYTKQAPWLASGQGFST